MRRDSRSRKSICQPLSFPGCRFGYSVLTTSAAWRITHLTWVHFHSSYWLPSTYPTCGYQEEHPLTIIFPSSGLCYIVSLATLFRVLGSSGATDGSLLSRWTALHTTSRRTAHTALEDLRIENRESYQLNYLDNYYTALAVYLSLHTHRRSPTINYS